jgi:hypothetical protein
MELGHLAPTRSAYYDRTATEKSDRYNGVGVAPHGATVRWTRTIPSGKKAYVQGMYVMTIRKTAAAPVGEYQAAIRITPSAGTAVLLAKAMSASNVVDALTDKSLAATGLIVAATVIEALTSDGSTGGTVTFDAGAHWVEFDA